MRSQVWRKTVRKDTGMVEKEKPDLVLSDIKMPVLDGLGMLQKIKEADIEVQAVC